MPTLMMGKVSKSDRRKLSQAIGTQTAGEIYSDSVDWEHYLKSCPYTQILGDTGGAVIMDWGPRHPAKVILRYNHSKAYHEKLPISISRTIERWAKKDFNKFHDDPPAGRVRLEGVVYEPFKHDVLLDISPIKQLYYAAIHDRLDKRALAPLRRECTENALDFIDQNQSPILPSHLAVHMALVSADNHILFRKRRIERRYGDHWEISLGEFFQGPDAEENDLRETPSSIFRFLQRAVRDEIGYDKAEAKDFKVYGFAVERPSLAPKLLVVYTVGLKMQDVIWNARNSLEPAPGYEGIELSPKSLAEAFKNPELQPLTPLSIIAATYALTQHEHRNSAQLKLVRDLAEQLGADSNSRV